MKNRRAFRAMNIFQFIVEGCRSPHFLRLDEYGMLKPVGETSAVPGRTLAGAEEDDRLWKEALDLPSTPMDPRVLSLNCRRENGLRRWDTISPGMAEQCLPRPRSAWPMKKIALYPNTAWRMLPRFIRPGFFLLTTSGTETHPALFRRSRRWGKMAERCRKSCSPGSHFIRFPSAFTEIPASSRGR